MGKTDRKWKRFIYRNLVITFLLLAMGYAMSYILPEHFRFESFFMIPAFFAVASSTLHYFLIRRARNNMARFIPGFMGATGIKLLIYLLFLVLLLFLDKPHALPIGTSFIVVYLIYTLHEVISVLDYLRGR